MNTEEWITHDGGPCAFEKTDQIEVRYRIGKTKVTKAGYVIWWDHKGKDYDIIAVRLIKPLDAMRKASEEVKKESEKFRGVVAEVFKDMFAKETPKQRASREAWERFTQSARYKEMHPQPVAMIGEVEESRIAGEALAAFDRVWPRKV